MTDEKIIHKRYDDLMSRFEDYSSTINELYMLKTDDEEEIQKLFEKIKTKLIETNIFTASQIINEISIIIQFRNRYLKSYFSLFKVLYDEYKPREEIPAIFVYLLSKDSNNLISTHCEKEFTQFEEEKVSFEVHEKGSVFRSIMDDDLQSLKTYMDNQGFETKIKLRSSLYPYTFNGISLIELSCYYGSLLFFNLLKTKYNMRVTNTCLSFSFLSGNQFIIDECLRHQTPNSETMRYAIISHNIEYVTSLFDEYGIMIDLSNCSKYKNIEALAAHYEITGDIQSCCYYSFGFCLQPLVQYFISLGADLQSTMNMFTDSNKQLNTRETSLPSTYSSYSAESPHKKHHQLLLKLLNANESKLFPFGINNGEQKRSLTSKLISAVENSDKDKVEFLINHGENIDEKDFMGFNALHHAIGRRNKEIIRILLSHGADIESEDNYKHTPLMTVIRYNYKDIVEYLVENGCDINNIGYFGFSPLGFAIYNNANEIAEYLINHDSDLNKTNKLGMSPLQLAFQNQNKELIEMLIKKGAEFSKDLESSILQYAIKNKYQQIIDLIVSKRATKPMNLVNNYIGELFDQHTLHYAVRNNDVELADFLINNGVNVNETNNLGDTPLRNAILNNNLEIAEFLINHGANVNQITRYNEPILLEAIRKNEKEMLELLVKHNADLEIPFDYGKTVVRYAIENNLSEIVEILLSHRAKLNGKYLFGGNELHFAIQKGMKQIAKSLISHGIDLNAVDGFGKAAIHYAVEKDMKDITKELLSHGADINIGDESGNTVLHYSAFENHFRKVKFIIKHGCNINAKKFKWNDGSSHCIMRHRI